MELGRSGDAAGPRDFSRHESEALLNALRPFCMSAMLALEGMLGSEGDRAAGGPLDAGAATARVAAGRRLGSALSSLHSSLSGRVSSSASRGQASGFRRALSPALPFVMLPLQLALAPANRDEDGRGGGVAKMPAAVREKALLCVAAAIRGSGSSFVEGYGVRPTANILIGLVFTVSECSPMSARSSLPNAPDNATARGGSGGVFKGAAGGGGSGLTGGTDALRLACLECLEAVLRAPFDPAQPASSAPSNNDADQSAWSGVRDTLRTAAGGGILAQLVQELLLCCQGGSAAGMPVASNADATAAAAGSTEVATGEGWGGAEAARAAAGCLDALCVFASGSDIWRRFLPGTFSGLFRAIRGMEVGTRSSAASGETPPLASISFTSLSSLVSAGGGTRGGGGGGGSNSALAEMCISILATVLLMCADGRPIATVPKMDVAASPPALGEVKKGHKAGAAGGSADLGSEGVDCSADSAKDNPLAALQRLAIISNARETGSGGGGTAGHPNSSHTDAGRSMHSDGVRPSTSAALSRSVSTPAGTVAAGGGRGGSADSTWEADTSQRLCLLLPPLLAFCRLHPGWRVRRAAATFASTLLANGGRRQDVGLGEAERVRKGSSSGAGVESGRGGGREGGLLGPLAPLLMEALVGLVMDDMPQVSAAAREGLDGFRASLSPLRWLSLRGVLLERLCAIVEGLPALAKSADEKRLRAAFDLLAGYLSLLKFDARAALDARLSTLLSCLCDALEFDQDFNVQVLEGSYDNTTRGESSRTLPGAAEARGSTEKGRGHEDGIPKEATPKYYQQVLANVREDATLASARRAVRLLGVYGDLPTLADAVLSSLETRPPRPPPRRSAPSLSLFEDEKAGTSGTLAAFESRLSSGGGDSSGEVRRRDSDGLYRRRWLKWLQPRLPMAWVLNHAFLGRVTTRTAGGEGGIGTGSVAPAEGMEGLKGGPRGGEAADRGFGRGVAIALLERLLASHAFSLPVSRAEAASGGYGGGISGGTDNGLHSQEAALSVRGGSIGQGAAGYTRSGEVLGGGRNARVPGVSAQVLDANATMVSTIIEALASLAEACGPGFGELFLLRALYPLLEKVASSHPVVSQAALATLWRVRSACGDYKDVSQLLEGNMDYVVDDVLRQVAATGASARRRGRTPSGGGGGALSVHEGGYGGREGSSGAGGIPAVVEAVLRIGGSAMGPALVRDLAGVTLREVDACAWDPRQTRRSLGVLRAVVSCVSLPRLSPGVGGNDGEIMRSEDVKSIAASASCEKQSRKATASEEASAAAGASELAESPWFRQLFVEFADPTDIQRATERGGDGSAGLLQAVREHRQAMGFDYADENTSAEDILKQSVEEVDEEEEVGDGSLPEPDAEGRRMAESQEVKTLSEVLSRSCHFLATPSLGTQALALACMRDCVLKLASAGADAALLPHVHRAWRPLMATFREHLTPLPTPPPRSSSGDDGDLLESLASRRAVILHALDTVDILIEACGDFLSSKVSEDLWPLLKLLLLQRTSSKTVDSRRNSRNTTSRTRPHSSSSSNAILIPSTAANVGPSNGEPNPTDSPFTTLTNSLLVVPSPKLFSASIALGGSGRDTGGVISVERAAARGEASIDEKVVVRALGCLEHMCRSKLCERYMTPLAREVALIALPFLSSDAPGLTRSSAEALFRRLSFLDGDGVWLLLLQTLDAAAQNEQQQQGNRPVGRQTMPVPSLAASAVQGAGGTDGDVRRGGRPSRRAEAMATSVFGARSERVKGARHRPVAGVGAGEGQAVGAGVLDEDSWLPAAPAVPMLTKERPSPLAERRSTFAGGKVARECARSAANLLSLLNAAGSVAEHM